MYLIVIAWMYVVLMMSVAEATNSNGSVLGALVTFALYGAGPVALVVYLMRAPARSKAIKRRDALAHARRTHLGEPGSAVPATLSVEPDAGGHPSGSARAISCATTATVATPAAGPAADGGIAPVRKEP